jgi:hypothetical protein
MGRKGKMSGYGEHSGKWQSHAYLQDLSRAISYARQSAYDSAALEKKRREYELLRREKKSYAHLRFLIEDRISDDRRERSGVPPQWLRSLVTSSDKAAMEARDRSYQESKVRARESIYRELLSDDDSRCVKRVPSLSLLCLETIAVHLNDYDDDDIQMVIGSLAPEVAERLICLASRQKTLTNSNIKKLLHPQLESLTLGENITDSGLLGIVKSFTSHVKSFGEQVDSWEQADWADFDLSGLQSMSLNRLCLIQCEVSMVGLASVPEIVAQVSDAVFHDIDFSRVARSGKGGKGVAATSVSTSTAFYGDAISDLANIFPQLSDLYISYCSWLTLQVLDNWIDTISQNRVGLGLQTLSSSDCIGSATGTTSVSTMTASVAAVQLPFLKRITVRGLRITDSPNAVFSALRILENKYSAFGILLDVSVANLK